MIPQIICWWKKRKSELRAKSFPVYCALDNFGEIFETMQAAEIGLLRHKIFSTSWRFSMHV